MHKRQPNFGELAAPLGAVKSAGKPASWQGQDRRKSRLPGKRFQQAAYEAVGLAFLNLPCNFGTTAQRIRNRSVWG